MNDQFIALDKLLLELVFQSEQDSNAKEDAKQQITLLCTNIREKKRNIFTLQDKINTIDDEIAHYHKHNKYIKDDCTNRMPTHDVLHDHEAYLQDQFQNHQETTEKDKKMYHDYLRQYKDTLKQYQLQYSKTPFAQEYYRSKTELEEIKNQILTCTEQCKIKESTLMELLVPAPFKSLSQWTLQIVHLRSKTDDILKCASTFTHKSSKLKEEADEIERKINYLNQQTARISETKNLLEIPEEKSKKLEKIKEFKDRIFEEHFHISNENLQNSQRFLPYSFQNLVRPVRNDGHFSEPRETDEKEESSSSHSTLAGTDFRPERKEVDDSVMNKYSQVSALKSTQNLMQFRSLILEKQPKCKQTFDKGSTDSECGEKQTEGEIKDSINIPQDGPTECTGKSKEDNQDETEEENNEKFPATPEMPHFLRTPEFLKTPEYMEKYMEKIEFSKSPSSELLRNIGLEAKSQKTPHTFPFLMSSSTSPGFSLFESSEFGNENLPDQFDENYSSGNLNPVSSQKDIGGLFGKLEEDTFTFPFSSEPSAHTFGDGKDDFSFSFSFEQDQHSSRSSSSNSFPSSQNSKQFTFF